MPTSSFDRKIEIKDKCAVTKFYVALLDLTDEEKYKMYKKLSKKKIIEMLIEANKHLARLTPKYEPKCDINKKLEESAKL